jgi:hypothetical protein
MLTGRLSSVEEEAMLQFSNSRPKGRKRTRAEQEGSGLPQRLARRRLARECAQRNCAGSKSQNHLGRACFVSPPPLGR